MSRKLLVFIVLLTFLIGCSKDKNSQKEAVKADVICSDTLQGQPKIADITRPAEDYKPDIAPYQEYFDWEKLDYLPVPSWIHKTAFPMPWNDRAKRYFSNDILNDYKKADGWELYLGSFSTQYIEAGMPQFSLYNKYSGILRYYFFNPFDATGVQNYNILLNNIKLWGNYAPMSPMLNFANQKIIDVSKNSEICTTFDPQPLTDSTWYAVDYELAFDKNIYSQNANSFYLANYFSMIMLPSLSINGKSLNTLNAKIRLSDVMLGEITSYTGDVSLLLYGKSDLNQASDLLSQSDLTKLNQIMNQHSFNNLLSGTLDDNSMGKMKWDANISFTRSLSGVGLTDNTLPISGSDISSIIGLCPFYTKPLGVFYLNQKPICILTRTLTSDHSYQYKLDVNSVEYVFNPSVTEIADIKNIRQELVATEGKSTFQDYSSTTLFTGQKLTSNIPLTIQGVRVSFDVVPKDGGKTTHIIKTFLADLVTPI